MILEMQKLPGAKPGRRCPYCNDKMECTASSSLEQTEPEPGNLAVCFRCLEICMFDEKLDLRRLTAEEFRRIQAAPVWEIITALRQANEMLKLILGIEEAR